MEGKINKVGVSLLTPNQKLSENQWTKVITLSQVYIRTLEMGEGLQLNQDLWWKNYWMMPSLILPDDFNMHPV